MGKTKIIFLFIYISVNFAFGQFKPNSIGVCYLEKEMADGYYLTIALPYQTLDSTAIKPIGKFSKIIDSLAYSGQIILFDGEGELCQINNKEKFLIELWCENDGGTQYRPILQTKIKKADVKRKLIGVKELQNICCFVLINKKNEYQPDTDVKKSNEIKLNGDYNKDKKIDCFIWTYHDAAKNCSGEPKNNLGIELQIGKQHYTLRCCGP